MNRICWAFMFGIVIACNVQAADFRIGFVDTERILRESEQALAAQKALDKEFAARNLEIKQLAEKIKDMQQKTEGDRDQLSESLRRVREREIANLNLQLQTLQREFREDLSLRQNEELAQILARADKAIRAIAESEQYDVILQEAVYRNPRIDITDKVLKFMEGESLPASGQ